MKPNPFSSFKTAFIMICSLIVVASVIPSFYFISSVPILVYYLFFPGYSVIELLDEGYGIVQKLLFSVALGTSIALGLSSFRQTFHQISLPFNVVLPLFTMLLTLYVYYHPRESVPI